MYYINLSCNSGTLFQAKAQIYISFSVWQEIYELSADGEWPSFFHTLFYFRGVRNVEAAL